MNINHWLSEPLAVGLFHIWAHVPACQRAFSGIRTKLAGLLDGELAVSSVTTYRYCRDCCCPHRNGSLLWLPSSAILSSTWEKQHGGIHLSKPSKRPTTTRWRTVSSLTLRKFSRIGKILFWKKQSTLTTWKSLWALRREEVPSLLSFILCPSLWSMTAVPITIVLSRLNTLSCVVNKKSCNRLSHRKRRWLVHFVLVLPPNFLQANVNESPNHALSVSCLVPWLLDESVWYTSRLQLSAYTYLCFIEIIHQG